MCVMCVCAGGVGVNNQSLTTHAGRPGGAAAGGVRCRSREVGASRERASGRGASRDFHRGRREESPARICSSLSPSLSDFNSAPPPCGCGFAFHQTPDQRRQPWGGKGKKKKKGKKEGKKEKGKSAKEAKENKG